MRMNEQHVPSRNSTLCPSTRFSFFRQGVDSCNRGADARHLRKRRPQSTAGPPDRRANLQCSTISRSPQSATQGVLWAAPRECFTANDSVGDYSPKLEPKSMKMFLRFIVATATGTFVCAGLGGQTASAKPAHSKRLLLVTTTLGFRHAAVTVQEELIREMAASTGEFTIGRRHLA